LYHFWAALRLRSGNTWKQTSRPLGDETMPVFEQKRDEMIEHLEAALALADELKDSMTGYLIERALDEARAAIVNEEVPRTPQSFER
jgi:hypothetical protein